MLTFAEYCLQRDWEVDLFWKEDKSIEKAKQRFDLKLDGLNINSSIYKRFGSDASHMDKIINRFKLPNYDLIFYLSDGSIPNLHAKQNWLHFQAPFQIKGDKFWTQQKLSHINKVICNSNLTKSFIDKSFNINANIIYPPVSVHDFHVSNIDNENIILNVGRFDQIMNAKRQDILIETFKKMIDNGLEDWWLIFAGGLQHNEDQLLRLREMAVGYPIDFHINIAHEEIVSWYHRSHIYWHAAGYEIDDSKQPEKVEHFGISIVEAMAAGCIPMVYPSGGVKEIITDKKNGYYWKSSDQLSKMTQNIIDNLGKEEHIIEAASKRSHEFSKEAFFKKVDDLLER